VSGALLADSARRVLIFDQGDTTDS